MEQPTIIVSPLKAVIPAQGGHLVSIPVNVTADSGNVTSIPVNVTEDLCCAF